MDNTIDAIDPAAAEKVRTELAEIMNNKDHPLHEGFTRSDPKALDTVQDMYRKVYGTKPVELGTTGGVTITSGKPDDRGEAAEDARAHAEEGTPAGGDDNATAAKFREAVSQLRTEWGEQADTQVGHIHAGIVAMTEEPAVARTFMDTYLLHGGDPGVMLRTLAHLGSRQRAS